jgi:predicted RNA methylase
MTRTSLLTETLRVLTREELGDVAGGTGPISRTCVILNPSVVYAVANYTAQQLSLNCAHTGG